MWRLVRFILIAAMVLLPTAARSDPSPVTSVVPPVIRLLTAQPYGPAIGDVYTVIVNDEFGIPIPEVPVFLDFAPCSHVMFAAEQEFSHLLAIDCAAETLRVLTDEAGVANFLVYGSMVQRTPMITDVGCVAVYAGRPAVLLGFASAVTFDLDGVNGLTANDLAMFMCDFGEAFPYARTDYDATGDVGINDLTLWIQKYLSAKGNARSAAHCGESPASTPQVAVAGTPLRLAWGACAADGGTTGRVFACGTNSGSETLVASFVAPAGVLSLSGFDAQLWIVGAPGSDIASWWRYDQAACRSASLPTITGGAATCLAFDPSGLTWTAFRQAEYPGLIGEFPNVIVLRVTGALSEPAQPLVAGEEYALFTVNIPHAKTIGAGSCAGCAEPVMLMLDWVKLRQSGVASVGCSLPDPGSPLSDFLMRQSENSIAFWQGTTGPIPLDVPTTTEGFRLTLTSPSRGGARLTFSLPGASRCTLALYDIAGRCQRVLLDGDVPAGSRTLVWDGRDDGGREMSSGYYVVKLSSHAGTLTRSLVHLR